MTHKFFVTSPLDPEVIARTQANIRAMNREADERYIPEPPETPEEREEAIRCGSRISA